ncbi:MAG: arylsulfatase [Bacteroidota bacterium]
MRIRSILVLLLLSLFSCERKASSEAEIQPKPNIIFILADDLGYADVGFMGNEIIETPHIDQLAGESLIFTQHYSGNTVCAPSRSAWITGLHTGHTPIRGNKEVKPEGQYPMPDTLMTIPKLMKQAGYVTGGFGKWGLGFIGTSGDPMSQGFDQFYGYNCQRYAHRYYSGHIWDNDQKVELPENGWENKVTYAPDLIHQQSLEFMEENRENPFFLFLPIIMPHAELAAPEDALLEKYRQKIGEEKPHVGGKAADYGPDMNIGAYQSQPYPKATHAAMVERIDRYVGEVIRKLEGLGLRDNTLIFFASDNGPHQEGGHDPDFFDSNGPYRGYKRDLYEGGIRTFMIANWPGEIDGGRQTDHPSAFWDMMPTLAELTGQPVPDTDGISFLPTLLNEPGQDTHEYMYWEFHELGGRQAIRQGDWKLIKLNVKQTESLKVELYDVAVDPGEKKDLSKEFPEKVEELSRLIDKAHRPNSVFPLFESEK